MSIGYLDPWGRSPKQHLNTRAFSQKVDEGSGLNSSYSNVCPRRDCRLPNLRR